MRLVNADELEKAVINNFDNLQAYFPKDFIEEINNAPTVEPKTKLVANVTFDKEQMEELAEKAKVDILAQIERPKGEWIKQYNKSYELKTNEGILVGEFTKCPKCQYDKARGSNFCPNCGADMRGEK